VIRIITATAVLAAALIAVRFPDAREIIATAGIGVILILGNIQIGNHQLAQARKVHALVEQSSRRIASHL
jgi:hypothetical protein